jgi:hypothetical protein
MAKLSYPTSRTIQCPLLIDASQLESLDRIIDDHIPQMRDFKDKMISDLVVRQVRASLEKGYIKEEQRATAESKTKTELAKDYDFRESRSVALYLSKGREIQAGRFSEAISQPMSDDEIAVGFMMRVRVADIKAEVKLEYSYAQRMDIEVEPKDNEVAQGLFGALSNWASDIEAPRWQQKWSDLASFVVLLLLLVLMCGLVLIPLVNWTESGKTAQKEEARKFLSSGGVNTTNVPQALQLLLAIDSDYNPGSVRTPPLGFKYWAYFALVTFILFAGSFYPTICIGLWGGKRHLRFWRSWIRILSVGIPTLILIPVLLPWLTYWLKITPPSP